MRLALSLLLSLVFSLVVSCSKPTGETEPRAPDERCASGVAPLPGRIQRGISVAHSYQHAGTKGYGTETSAATLRELTELGVEWISLTPFGFMRSLTEPKVHSIGAYRAGETDDRMQREIRRAKALGLKVMLKPHIWIVRGLWRGEIELRSTERRQEQRWRQLVSEVRRRFHGEITYGANWDDAAALPWWDAVDYIGVQFYPPLATSEKASSAVIRAEVTARLDSIGAISRQHEKPVLFTEVGYRAAPNALIHPHEWPERTAKPRFDPRAQAMGYQMLLEAVRHRPWVKGLYWWKWFTDPDTTEEGPAGFSPRGKLAEAILRSAYGGNCAASSVR
ncbi:MAG: hypothetical protein JRE45_19470 [Deltaproteobacteria bacterium]|nr:hypothetical protein [Deltaproteobacteria bacterium]MBW2686284.1 hypothetical protein [Deltaproteobacteria bacterium]